MSAMADPTLTDCPCGGPRGVDGDGERWWVVCAACGAVSPMPPALPDAEWKRRVRVVRAMSDRGEL